MIQVSDNEERLDVVSPMPSWERVLFALFAMIPLFAPYELMLRVQWNDYRHPVFLLAVIISAGAVALSVCFVFLAVAGLSSRMTLDAARSTFTYSTRAPLVPRRTLVLPLFPLTPVPLGRRRTLNVKRYGWRFSSTGQDVFGRGPSRRLSLPAG